MEDEDEERDTAQPPFDGQTSINQTATRFEVAPNVTINLALVSSQRARSSASLANREYTAAVAWCGNEGWSLYGARWLQPVAGRGKCRTPEQGRIKPNRCRGLRPVAETSPW